MIDIEEGITGVEKIASGFKGVRRPPEVVIKLSPEEKAARLTAWANATSSLSKMPNKSANCIIGDRKIVRLSDLFQNIQSNLYIIERGFENRSGTPLYLIAEEVTNDGGSSSFNVMHRLGRVEERFNPRFYRGECRDPEMLDKRRANMNIMPISLYAAIAAAETYLKEKKYL